MMATPTAHALVGRGIELGDTEEGTTGGAAERLRRHRGHHSPRAGPARSARAVSALRARDAGVALQASLAMDVPTIRSVAAEARNVLCWAPQTPNVAGVQPRGPPT